MRKLEGLEPQRVFYYFEEICRIPHGSGNTGAMTAYLLEFAGKHGLKSRSDQAGNVVIYKPASPGHEESRPVILQGHIDMVAEKEPGSGHDFLRDPLELQVEGDLISARETTLGGDDGIAVAYCLAVLESSQLVHPPLEAVFTTDEEIGMLGAAALDTSWLSGRTLLNMDSEDEGIFCAGCAGGLTGTSRIPVRYGEASGMKYSLKISGLKGGHSGICIGEERINALCMMGRVLHRLREKAEYLLCELFGGQKDNAIPQEARAAFLADEADEEILRETLALIEKEIRGEYQGSDGEVTLTLQKLGAATEPVLHPVSLEKVLFFLVQLPNGVYKRSGVIAGLVETSMNLGILRLTPEELVASGSFRSSVESGKEALAGQVEYLTEFLGGSFQREGIYPAWEYREDSPLREILISTYRELFGKEPVTEVIHAGLECGIFYGSMPGLDCVSFGPQMYEIHTARERLSVSSVERVWRLLVKTLEKLA
ncbi:MAG TPA: aminoacyl-histidine dipeptidase [Candidatus Egerieimonas intestinavium]|uniref:Cytosol non-specific dipeptidase n=1 Tax=Candidatus Egerieimonas intestinavium TaxID=2840777 RepID=A0A9D1EIJ4_9FIRM|nr:aminoacyl-histidine dipeptidase [Candidatus Egerieimonas intestinavium]